MYVSGSHGLPKDVVQGYAWLSVAAANGIDKYGKKETMENVAKTMSKSQIDKAQKLAKEIWEKMNKANENR